MKAHKYDEFQIRIGVKFLLSSSRFIEKCALPNDRDIHNTLPIFIIILRVCFYNYGGEKNIIEKLVKYSMIWKSIIREQGLENILIFRKNCFIKSLNKINN